jgi:solute carrier family 25 phosphate transporter 23/24/25/41
MPQGMGADASSPPRFVDELDERMKKAGEVSGSGRRAKYWPFSSPFSSSGTTTREKQKKQHREETRAREEEEKSLKTTTITEKKTEEDEDEETKTMTIVQRATSDTTKMLISGGVAGAFSKSCTAPLARLTILRQLQGTNAVPGWSNSVVAQKDLGIVKSLRHIVNTEGVRALWKGNGVTIAHRLPYSAINFYTYENTLDFLENEVEGRWNVKEYQAWEVTKRLAAGAFAGCFSCTLTYPLDLVRTRLAAQVTPTVRTSGAATTTTTMNGQQQQPHYKGILRSMRTIVSEEGARGLYRGLPPTLVGVGPNLAINFAAYETLRNYFGNNTGEFGKENPMFISLACGSASAVVSASATFPLDLVRRRMQMRDATKGDTFLAVFKRVIRKEGFVGLYRGIYPEFAKVVPGVSITYTTYELLKRLAGVDTGRM